MVRNTFHKERLTFCASDKELLRNNKYKNQLLVN